MKTANSSSSRCIVNQESTPIHWSSQVPTYLTVAKNVINGAGQRAYRISTNVDAHVDKIVNFLLAEYPECFIQSYFDHFLQEQEKVVPDCLFAEGHKNIFIKLRRSMNNSPANKSIHTWKVHVYYHVQTRKIKSLLNNHQSSVTYKAESGLTYIIGSPNMNSER